MKVRLRFGNEWDRIGVPRGAGGRAHQPSLLDPGVARLAAPLRSLGLRELQQTCLLRFVQLLVIAHRHHGLRLPQVHWFTMLGVPGRGTHVMMPGRHEWPPSQLTR